MFQLIKRYWDVIRKPSVHYSLGFLTLGGFIGGVVFWGGFNTAMEATNRNPAVKNVPHGLSATGVAWPKTGLATAR